MGESKRKRRIEELFGSKKFDVESSVNMYATSFVVIPAFAIYQSELIKGFMEQIKTCHIYFIGLLPKVDIVGSMIESDHLVVSFKVASKSHNLRWDLPSGSKLEGDDESGWYVSAPDGEKFYPTEPHMMARLNNDIRFEFEVLYIGQSFGDDGSRNALDRLLKHETLQKISLTGIPDGFALNLLLIEILPTNRMIMMMNPFAKDASQGNARIDAAVDKLKNTTMAERVTLYEASMIRYFLPKYNKEFKNSFPSTNLKLLGDCYQKDITAVTAEISFDELPFRIKSETIEARDWHIAHHDLHKDEDRKVFFLDRNLEA